MLADLRQRLLDRLLGTGVDVCRRLIQNQYLRGIHQHARQRQQLLLPDGEIIALLAQLGCTAHRSCCAPPPPAAPPPALPKPAPH